jgi:hypothetical protein
MGDKGSLDNNTPLPTFVPACWLSACWQDNQYKTEQMTIKGTEGKRCNCILPSVYPFWNLQEEW